MTSVRLPEEIEQRLEFLAQTTKRSKSFFICEALDRYLEEVGDVYEALDRIASPNREFLTTAEVLKALRNSDKA